MTAALLALACLAAWLSERVPPFVPTLALLALAPLATGRPMAEVLAWVADPILVLFLGGFALGAAASAHGIDRRIVDAAIRWAGGRPRTLVVLVALSTAFLSMWMSNVAAAALLLGALGPLRSAPVLLAVALGANLGGLATPIGTGPNAIALAEMADPPTFLGWMVLALPLALGALAVGVGLILAAHPADAGLPPSPPRPPAPDERPLAFAAVAGATVAAWLLEPLHGVPAAIVAAGATAVIFGARLLPAHAFARLDWSTLALVAGGIALGRLLETAGLVSRLASAILSLHAPQTALLALVLAATAGLSAVMSNTATATLLVPVAAALLPHEPGAPMLVALAASFGMPFAISTPPNAMAVGAGLPARDLLLPGAVLGAGGCAVLALTGPWVL